MIDQKSNHIINDGIDIVIPRTVPYIGKAIIAKLGRVYSDYQAANRRMINTLVDSRLTTGEILNAGSDSFITVVSKKEVIGGQEVSIIAHGLLCNATLSVTRDTVTYDADGNANGMTPQVVISAIPCRADLVNARMRQEDPGLLATTVLKVCVTYNASLKLLDKSDVSGNSYRVDSIDRLEIPGAMVLQLSAWVG